MLIYKAHKKLPLLQKVLLILEKEREYNYTNKQSKTLSEVKKKKLIKIK